MKGLKLARRGAVCALVAALLCSVGALAVGHTDSEPNSFGRVGAEMYDFHATLYTDANAKWRAATWVQSQNGQVVPAGYMKAKTYLYDGEGNLYKSTVAQANTAPASYFLAMTPGVTGKGPYYAVGQVTVYMGSGESARYNTLSTQMAAAGETDVLAKLAKAFDKDGYFPLTAQGLTYGSGLRTDNTGTRPDLIAAVGTNDVKGYVRLDELDPYTATPKEAAALAAAVKDSVLPLYDLNGKVIGTFVQDVGVTSNSKSFAGCSYEAARERAAKGPYMTPARTAVLPKTDAELTALAEQALTITPYSRNSKGQTYGSDIGMDGVGYAPKLIAVCSTNNDKDGYVVREDLNRQPENVKSRTIPVYDLDGKVIGEFKIESGSSLTPEQIADQLARHKS